MPSLLALLILAGPASLPAGASELRGLWVVRTGLVSPQEVDRVVDEAVDGGLNALFVQVRGRGDAFYQSQLAPRSPLIEAAGFDPLARLLERARSRGIAVHAWVNVLLSAHFGQPLPPGHVLAEHPDWMMVPRSAAASALSVEPRALHWLVYRASRGDGDVEGYYLSPSAPGVGEYLEAVVRELVRGYPVDGLHLDFVRYPGPEYDYSRAALEGFRRARGGAGDLLAAPSLDPAAWEEYRRDVLTDLVERLVRAARAERPGMIVSAAVVSDETLAVHHKYQDWPRWAAARLFDALCPMAYTPEDGLFRAQVERARALLGAGRELWAGIGAYRLPLDSVIAKVRIAREAGASGVLLFSHESLAPGEWKRLRQGAFPAATAAGSVGAQGIAANPR